MAHRFLHRSKFTLRRTFRVAIVGSLTMALWSANADPIQAPDKPAPAKLGAFLNQFEAVKIPARTRIPKALQYGSEALAGYRYIKTKQPDLIEYKAYESFRTECVALGGTIGRYKNPAQMVNDYLYAKTNPWLSGNDQPIICLDVANKPLGTLVRHSQVSTYSDGYTMIYLMTPAATSEMLDIYAEKEKWREVTRVGLERQRLADELYIANWRKNLGIGDKSACGSVIEVRGPMVQVANGQLIAWVRKEALYPVGTQYWCDVR